MPHTNPHINPENSIIFPDNFSGIYEYTFRGRKKTISWEIIGGGLIEFSPKEDFGLLNIEDRVNIFNTILGPFRLKSTHHQGIYSAAICITNTGQIFIAVNTQLQHEYYKDCAEVNMVNTMISALKRHHPEVLIDEVHLMMGFYNPDIEEVKRSGRTPIENGSEAPYCTCGKCTDLLARVSSTNSLLVTYPANDGSLALKVDFNSQSIQDVQPGTIWVTKFSVLLYGSEISLTDKEAKNSQQALSQLQKRGNWTSRFNPSNTEVTLLSRLLRKSEKDLSPELVSKLKDAIKTQKELYSTDDGKLLLLEKEFSIGNLNKFMLDKIDKAYYQRPEVVEKSGIHNIQKVRCVVVRLDDGTFRNAVEVEGPKDNASPYAECRLAAEAGEMLRNVTDMWVMELCPQDIVEGKMHTSSKEGLERILKKRPITDGVTDVAGNPIKDNIRVHYIPYNTGKLPDQDIEKSMRSFDINEIFASRFMGVKFDPNCNHSGGGPAVN